MPGTFQAVAVIVAGVLPGALYVWAFERQVGRWGIGLADRVLRFFGTSAVLHALIAPLTYASYRELFASGALRRADALPAMFACRPDGWIGLKLKSGRWIGGRSPRATTGHPARTRPGTRSPATSTCRGRRRSTRTASSSRPRRHMAKNPGRRTSRSTRLTRGGYTSGSNTVSELKPPPKGPAVGVKKTRSR